MDATQIPGKSPFQSTNTGQATNCCPEPFIHLVDIQRIDEAAVIGGDGLHGREIREEGRLHGVLQAKSQKGQATT
jgi:hypothetical protein